MAPGFAVVLLVCALAAAAPIVAIAMILFSFNAKRRQAVGRSSLLGVTVGICLAAGYALLGRLVATDSPVEPVVLLIILAAGFSIGSMISNTSVVVHTRRARRSDKQR